MLARCETTAHIPNKIALAHRDGMPSKRHLTRAVRHDLEKDESKNRLISKIGMRFFDESVILMANAKQMTARNTLNEHQKGENYLMQSIL